MTNAVENKVEAVDLLKLSDLFDKTNSLNKAIQAIHDQDLEGFIERNMNIETELNNKNHLKTLNKELTKEMQKVDQKYETLIENRKEAKKEIRKLVEEHFLVLADNATLIEQGIDKELKQLLKTKITNLKTETYTINEKHELLNEQIKELKQIEQELNNINTKQMKQKEKQKEELINKMKSKKGLLKQINCKQSITKEEKIKTILEKNRISIINLDQSNKISSINAKLVQLKDDLNKTESKLNCLQNVFHNIDSVDSKHESETLLKWRKSNMFKKSLKTIEKYNKQKYHILDKSKQSILERYSKLAHAKQAQ